MKLKKLTIFLIVVLALAVFSAVLGLGDLVEAARGVPSPTLVSDPRPAPPHIQEWGIPDPQGGEPAGCAGQDGCGLMCFYISEDATANQYEMSCVPWIFE